MSKIESREARARFGRAAWQALCEFGREVAPLEPVAAARVTVEERTGDLLCNTRHLADVLGIDQDDARAERAEFTLADPAADILADDDTTPPVITWYEAGILDGEAEDNRRRAVWAWEALEYFAHELTGSSKLPTRRAQVARLRQLHYGLYRVCARRRLSFVELDTRGAEGQAEEVAMELDEIPGQRLHKCLGCNFRVDEIRRWWEPCALCAEE